MNSNQFQLIDLFVKKVLAHLDEPNQNKLAEFLQYFQSPKTAPQLQAAAATSKIIYNSMPFADPTIFLTMWSQQIVQTQHVLSALDYHVIPGTNTILCNVNCKVRFDESGRDKLGQDSVVGSHSNSRPQWGSYFGVSMQVCLEDRIFRNDFNGVITALNYQIVYKPDDSLMKIM